MVRVVALDIDGTLLRDDGTISARTVQAIHDCRTRGISIVLVTARSPAETIPIAAATGIVGAAICCLGAVVYGLADATVHHSRPLSQSAAAALVTAVRTLAPTAAFGWVNAGGAGREPTYPHRRTLPGLRIGPIDQHLTDGVWHLFIRDANRQPLPADRIRAEIGDLADIIDYDHDPQLIDFTAAGVNKGTALQQWCASQNIPRAQVAAIGDSTADLPMLTWAGTSATVANATRALRATADHVLPDNNSDGVAVFLERLSTHT